jgi:hypothetical protein
MQRSRSSERPENKLPIVEPALSDYSKTPYRFHECLDVTKAKSHFVVLPGLVVPQKGQDPLIIVSGRIDRADNLLVSFEKVLNPHLGNEVH